MLGGTPSNSFQTSAVRLATALNVANDEDLRDREAWVAALLQPVEFSVRYHRPVERIACRELLYADAVVYKDGDVLLKCRLPGIGRLLDIDAPCDEALHPARTLLLDTCSLALEGHAVLETTPTASAAGRETRTKRSRGAAANGGSDGGDGQSGQGDGSGRSHGRRRKRRERRRTPPLPPTFDRCVAGCMQDIVHAHVEAGLADAANASHPIPREAYRNWVRVAKEAAVADASYGGAFDAQEAARIVEHECFRVLVRRDTRTAAYQRRLKGLGASQSLEQLHRACVKTTCLVRLLEVVPAAILQRLDDLGSALSQECLGPLGEIDLDNPAVVLQLCTSAEGLANDVDPHDVEALTAALPQMVGNVKLLLAMSSNDADGGTSPLPQGLDSLLAMVQRA